MGDVGVMTQRSSRPQPVERHPSLCRTSLWTSDLAQLTPRDGSLWKAVALLTLSFLLAYVVEWAQHDRSSVEFEFEQRAGDWVSHH